jgi:cyclophilin family peptidyl-prolyl cis-trans isomerase
MVKERNKPRIGERCKKPHTPILFQRYSTVSPVYNQRRKTEIKTMSARKSSARRNKREKSWGIKLDNIQIAGIIIAFVIVAAGIWLYVFTHQPASKVKQWTSAPPIAIDKSKQYFAMVTLAKGGKFVIQLYPDKAPITVNSFVFLARQGFYDGVTFHRVLEGFMAQGGDPTGTGTGGPGYEFVNEDNDLTFDKAGVVAMANAGRDTNGSQFFITFVPRPQLNGGYTIFGQVVDGMDVVNGITKRDPEQNPSFQGDAIQTITITEK